MDELKKNWMQEVQSKNSDPLNKTTLLKIVKQRANKQRNISMRYFWASLIFQIIVYGLLSHVIIRYWEDGSVVVVSFTCLLLYIPFTVVLLRKFKKMAVLNTKDRYAPGLPMNEFIEKQHGLLTSFYNFKRIYEMILIPISSAILIWVFFRLYLPGGVTAFPIAASVCFVITLGSCIAAIIAENKRHFKTPIKRLEEILHDMQNSLSLFDTNG